MPKVTEQARGTARNIPSPAVFPLRLPTGYVILSCFSHLLYTLFQCSGENFGVLKGLQCVLANRTSERNLRHALCPKILTVFSCGVMTRVRMVSPT